MHKLVSVAAAAAFAVSVAAPAVASAAPAPASASVATTDLRSSLQSYLQTAKLSAADKATVQALIAKLPAGFRLTPKSSLTKAVSHEWTAARNGAIDPSQYDCDPNTPVSRWLDSRLATVDMTNLRMLNNLGALDVPTYANLIFGQQTKKASFGVTGAHTNELTRTMRDLQGFWDIKSDDIALIPMHGAAVFQDRKLVSQTMQLLYGVPAATGDLYAEVFSMLLAADPALRGGDHPIFTFNAFAFSEADEAPADRLGISDRIIMGDGVLEGMDAIGLGRTAPRSILAHEFGHHVQYEKGLFNSPLTGAEATRRTELMADGFGAYFMTHKKGQALNKHLVLQDAAAFSNVGDCAFDNDGHHGTPNQRLRAAQWAGDLALASKPASSILPAMSFDALFEAKLPQLVAPDAK